MVLNSAYFSEASSPPSGLRVNPGVNSTTSTRLNVPQSSHTHLLSALIPQLFPTSPQLAGELINLPDSHQPRLRLHPRTYRPLRHLRREDCSKSLDHGAGVEKSAKGVWIAEVGAGD